MIVANICSPQIQVSPYKIVFYTNFTFQVGNLDRNIVITGDHDDFHTTGIGFHTGGFTKVNLLNITY